MKRLLVGGALFASLSGLGIVGRVHAGSSDKPQVAAAAKASTASDFVGSETCATCHADEAKKFPENPHWKLALTHGGNGVTCEGCHGPGKAHVDGGGDATKIFRFEKASAKQIDATCLGCHADAHPNFRRSEHAKANVSCTSCHSIHATHNVLTEDVLLKAPQPQLCYQCHADVKGMFAMHW